MSAEIRPGVVLVLNFIVGVAVAHGVIDQGNTDVVINQLSAAVGDAIVLFTVIASLIKFVHRAEIKGTTSVVDVPLSAGQSTVVNESPAAPVVVAA